MNIKTNFDQVQKSLGWMFKDQVPFMTQVTVNGLVKDARKNIIQTLPTYIHNPSGFTKKAVQFQETKNKHNPTAFIGFAGRGYGKGAPASKVYDSPNQYISRLITGGTRLPKRRAIATPVVKNEKITQAGNIRRGVLKKYLSDSKRYFSGVPKGFPDASAGIWRRMGRGGRKNITMLFTWKKQTDYQRQYPFGQVVKERIRKRFKKEFAIAFRIAMKTMK